MNISKIQSVVFKKSAYTIPEAISWLNNHNITAIKIDIITNYFWCGLHNPIKLKNEGYSRYLTKKLNNGDIELIIAYKYLFRHHTRFTIYCEYVCLKNKN